jgi:hypothetical protein
MFNYYTLTFYFKYIPGSIFRNSVYFSSADLISLCFSQYALKKTSVNKAMATSFAIAGSGGLIYLFFFWETTLIPVFILLSRIGVNMGFGVAYISNTRLFPTKYLATSYGI